MDIKQIGESIPDYQAFLTIDEQYASTRRLVADYPDRVTVQTIGQTRRGDPIELISVGEGPHNALAMGGPHPNEPYGCLAIEFLSRYFCENPTAQASLGYRWHFIKCLDIDGMRLNEGWFKGPFRPVNYYRHMFRPLMPEQPEMLFPMQYKTHSFNRPLPETLAIKAAIDTLRPRLFLSLHNAEFGGIYYYMSRLIPSLLPVFTEIPTWYDLPLDYGDSDQVGYIEKYAPAIFGAITSRAGYDYLVANGGDPASRADWGATSNEYAEELYGTFTLLTELPYWTDERINDATPLDITRRQALEVMVDRQASFFTWLKGHFETIQADLALNTPFHRAVADRIVFYLDRVPAQRRWLATATDLDQPATVAEQFRARYWKEHELMRMRGMFVRMIDAELAAGQRTPALDAARQTVAASLDEIGETLEREIQYRHIPIRSAVGVQVCAGLAAAVALRDEA